MTTEQVADRARRIVSGSRQDAYGHPLDNLGRTGRLWAAILGVPEVTAEQVALCMVAVKLSRETNRPGEDNIVDGIGYLLALHEIHQERLARA